MRTLRYPLVLQVVFFLFPILACNRDSQWAGQEPVIKVSTETVPIQLQYKGTFDLGGGVFVSNDFEGARLNGVARTNDSLVTVLN